MGFLSKEELTDLWNVTRILSEVDFDNASDDEKVDIFLERLSKRKLQKAYVYEKAKTVVLDVIEAEIKTKPSREMARKVGLWASRTARESAKETLQYPKVSQNRHVNKS